MKKQKSTYFALGVAVVSFALLVISPSRPRAQEPTPAHDHIVTDANVIDGAVHPERISDTDAYRMFLLAAISRDGSGRETAHQQSMFQAAHPTEEQMGLITQILADFAAKSDEALQAFNQEAAAANDAGTQPDFKEYNRQERALTQETTAKLELILGMDKASLLHRYIENEKKNMQIAVEE